MPEQPSEPDLRGWWMIIPLKDTRRAKSRLGWAVDERRNLAIAMANDTIAAVTSASRVIGVVLVCERQQDAALFPWIRPSIQPGVALNPALTGAAVDLVGEDSRRNLAALPADLPYLHAEELDDALERASHSRRAVVADRAGTGTTLLTARSGQALDPRFGPDSFRRHVSSGATAISLPDSSGLRRDVDVEQDLVVDGALGVRTSSALPRTITVSRAGRTAGIREGV